MIPAGMLGRAIQVTAIAGLCVVACAFAPRATAGEVPVNGDQQARENARKFGREGSAPGLEAVINSHDKNLVAAYEQGFRELSLKEPGFKPLPAEIEALIIKYYNDPQIGDVLRSLISQNRFKYQTRGLFDLMYADWRAGRVRNGYSLYSSIFQTDLSGIEAPLLESLKTMSQPELEPGTRLVEFLGRRKYLPAVPVFISMAKRAPPDSGLSYSLNTALLDIGTREATDGVLQRLSWLRAKPRGPQVTRETETLISRLAQYSVDSSLDYATLKKALPVPLSDAACGSLLNLIMRRKERQAAPDVLHLLANPRLYPQTLQVLVAMDSPEIWKQTRTEVERLKRQNFFTGEQYRYATTLLDGKIANPDAHFAEMRQRQRQQELDGEMAALRSAQDALQRQQDMPPAQYVDARMQLLKKNERLAQDYADLPTTVGLRMELGNDYLNLGHFVRFKLRQPQRALEIYAEAVKSGNGMGRFATADTCQFDLHDKARALAEYQRILDLASQVRSTNDMEMALEIAGRNWLTRQTEYLKTGKTFSGAITLDDIGGMALILNYGGAPMQEDYFGLASIYRAQAGMAAGGKTDAGQLRREIGKKLDTLPATSFALANMSPLLTLAPDADAIIRYLDRNDPAGYASALLLGYVMYLDQQGPAGQSADPQLPGRAFAATGVSDALRTAAIRYFRERHIELRAQADPRMSTPEATWTLFIGALKDGDVELAISCLTPGEQAKFRVAFTQLAPGQLRKMAESFGKFSMTGDMGSGMKEASVLRGNQAGMIYFVNVGGAWKISEM